MTNTTDLVAIQEIFGSLLAKRDKQSAWHGLVWHLALHLKACTRTGSWQPWVLPDLRLAAYFAQWAAECSAVSQVLAVRGGVLDWHPDASRYAKRRFMAAADDYVVVMFCGPYVLPRRPESELEINEDRERLLDSIAYAMLYAPDQFPHEDDVPPDEQLTLDRMFAELRERLGTVIQGADSTTVTVRCPEVLEEAYTHYREGGAGLGVLKLREMQRLIEDQRELRSCCSTDWRLR